MTASLEKINVLNVLHSFGTGGAETLVLSLLNKHDRKNFDWAVCGLMQAQRESLLKDFEKKGIKCYNLDLPAWTYYQRHPLEAGEKIMVLAKEFKRVCNEFRPDIVHSHLLWPTLLSNVLLFRSNVGLVTTFHNVVVGGSRLKRWASKLSVRVVRPVCIACSEAVREANASSGMTPKELCITIHNGVDTDEFDPRIADLPTDNPFDEQPDCLHVLQVGNLEPRKGYKYTIEALARLNGKNISIFVCCAGTGVERTELEKLAREMNVSGSIRFLGVRKDVKQLLKAADVFIMPSLYEGLSIAMLEAMSMELPVIASSVGGAPEVIEDGKSGFLIPPRDADALAEKLMILADDKRPPENMGKEARKRVVQEYSLSKQALALENLYKKIVEEKQMRKR